MIGTLFDSKAFKEHERGTYESWNDFFLMAKIKHK